MWPFSRHKHEWSLWQTAIEYWERQYRWGNKVEFTKRTQSRTCATCGEEQRKVIYE